MFWKNYNKKVYSVPATLFHNHHLGRTLPIQLHLTLWTTSLLAYKISAQIIRRVAIPDYVIVISKIAR